MFAPGALATLARSPALRHLTIYSEELDDARFLELAGSSIEELAVLRAPLGNPALAVLARLPQLTELRLRDVEIDDDGLAYIAAAPALRSLHLDGMPITDAGLLNLVSCPALRTLRLAGSKVTRGGLDDLHRAQPALEAVEI